MRTDWSLFSNDKNHLHKLFYRLPHFEYQRKDSSNNIYTYYNNDDYLLYNFSLPEGSIYPSQYAGLNWVVSSKYIVIGFGDTLDAMDLRLVDQSSNIKRSETITENFGLTYFIGDINQTPYTPEGSFFGGIINDSTYGYLLVKRQQIDWSEFYPLHIGDFWKYEGNEGQFQTTTFKSVVGDTIMPDGFTYKILESESFGGPYPGKARFYERVDNSGHVLGWNNSDSTSVYTYRFSTCLGDTFSTNSPDFYFRFDDKNYDQIHFFLYPDLIFNGYYFTKGLGLTKSTFEGGGEYLVGAVIDGKVYGDTTTVTDIKGKQVINDGFQLYQNYPNPFNPETNITFELSKSENISLVIYDILGREKKKLIDSQYYSKGYYHYKLAIRNEDQFSSGVYLIRLSTKTNSITNKLIYLK